MIVYTMMQEGWTPLMAATRSEEESLELVGLLLERGANINATAEVV